MSLVYHTTLFEMAANSKIETETKTKKTTITTTHKPPPELQTGQWMKARTWRPSPNHVTAILFFPFSPIHHPLQIPSTLKTHCCAVLCSACRSGTIFSCCSKGGKNHNFQYRNLLAEATPRHLTQYNLSSTESTQSIIPTRIPMLFPPPRSCRPLTLTRLYCRYVMHLLGIELE